METMTINGEEWVRKADAERKASGGEAPENVWAVDYEDFPYAIVRTYSAGVFAGYVKVAPSGDSKQATLLKARRLWYWDGAASLSELAVHGVAKPENCKFPCEVPLINLTEVIEVIPATKKAQDSIAGVAEWRMR